MRKWRMWIFFFIAIVLLGRTLLKWSTPRGEQSSIVQSGNWTLRSVYLDVTDTGEKKNLLLYGEELIAHTAKYLGPRGTIAQITNGMNCQNCHLDAGTRWWGNNYGGVYSTYPKFRDRSGTLESIYKRVSDCMERSLNGKALDSNSREMQAMMTYINWVGMNVEKGSIPTGTGIAPPVYLDRAADPLKGSVVYAGKCQSCHGSNGEGQRNSEGDEFTYPPLWGPESYNTGAGLYRLSRLAGFVRDNMPYGLASHEAPALSDEESWDVAAFVNSRPRPVKELTGDWPDISKKPVDHPFGPFADGFTELQHKYGPFEPIIAKRKGKK